MDNKRKKKLMFINSIYGRDNLYVIPAMILTTPVILVMLVQQGRFPT